MTNLWSGSYLFVVDETKEPLEQITQVVDSYVSLGETNGIIHVRLCTEKNIKWNFYSIATHISHVKSLNDHVKVQERLFNAIQLGISSMIGVRPNKPWAFDIYICGGTSHFDWDQKVQGDERFQH